MLQEIIHAPHLTIFHNSFLDSNLFFIPFIFSLFFYLFLLLQIFFDFKYFTTTPRNFSDIPVDQKYFMKFKYFLIFNSIT